MFGDIFATQEDILQPDSQAYTSIQSNQQRRPKNCASQLDLPTLKRETKQFAGLKNLGATCYLNSFIQSIFMSPEFRNIIYKLPLCAETIDQKTEFMTNVQKFNMLIAFQKMFAQMQALDARYTSTEDLVKSFGWESNEQLQQQDIQEAIRVIFDCFDRALNGTQFSKSISEYYKGTIVNHITCMECMFPNEREEDFFDLILQIKGFKNLEESLYALVTPETLSGSNQYYCEVCGKKNDALKGQKLRKLPKILTISLNRFEFDFEKMDRVKINDQFQFPLELNVSNFVEYQGEDVNKDTMNYELFTVLIHSGNAYGGHYHAYIRDVIGESNWPEQLEKMLEEKNKRKKKKQEEEEKQRIEQEAKKMQQEDINILQKQEVKDNAQENKEQMQEEKPTNIQPQEVNQQQNTENVVKIPEELVKKMQIEVKKIELNEEMKNNEQNDIQNMMIDEDNEEEDNEQKNDEEMQDEKAGKQKKKMGKRQNKGRIKKQNQKKDKSKKQQKQEKGKDNKEENKNQKDKKREILDDTLFDDIDYPIPFNNVELAKNWYDMNDNRITAIPVNRLQTQFGGSSESCYILIYRQKGLDTHIQKPILPNYLQKYVDQQNEIINNERLAYWEAEKNIELFFAESDKFVINEVGPVWKDKYEIEKQGKKIKFRIDCTIGLVLQAVSEQFNEECENLILIEVYELGNNYLQILRALTLDNFDKTIEQLQISHLSHWFILNKNTQMHIFNQIQDIIGEAFIPMKINIFFQQKNNELLSYSNMTLRDLRLKLEKRFGVEYDEQYIKMYEGSDQLVFVNNQKEKDQLNIKQLKISEGTDIILDKIDEKTKQQIDKLNQTEEQKMVQEIAINNDNLISILVERDDEDGVIRMFIDLNMKLTELLQLIIDRMQVDKTVKRRLRKLLGNCLYYKDEYEKSLQELNFTEGGIRLKIERGEIPESGNIAIKFRNDSKFKSKDKPDRCEVICDIKTSIQDLKTLACAQFGMDPNQHKLYKTDWMEEAIQQIQKENQIIRDLQLKSGELFNIRDVDSPIEKEFLHLNIFITQSGFPNDTKLITDLKIKDDNTLKDLKKIILSVPEINTINEEIPTNKLRVRDIKKDQFFGIIHRNEDKQLKKINFNTNNIAVQILKQPELISEDTIVLILRKRDISKKNYLDQQEMLFQASKNPTIEELKISIIAFLKLEIQLPDIELAKYFPYDFKWLPLNRQEYEEYKQKKKATKKIKKGGKKKKVKEESESSQKKDDHENIRKSPFLIKDGDIIGYRLESENQDKSDDFQTEDDQIQMVIKQKNQKKDEKIYKGHDKQGFKVNLDF